MPNEDYYDEFMKLIAELETGSDIIEPVCDRLEMSEERRHRFTEILGIIMRGYFASDNELKLQIYNIGANFRFPNFRPVETFRQKRIREEKEKEQEKEQRKGRNKDDHYYEYESTKE